jgi:hypothetical protein
MAEVRQPLVEEVIAVLLEKSQLSLDAAKQALGDTDAASKVSDKIAILEPDLSSYDALIASETR